MHRKLPVNALTRIAGFYEKLRREGTEVNLCRWHGLASQLTKRGKNVGEINQNIASMNILPR